MPEPVQVQTDKHAECHFCGRDVDKLDPNDFIHCNVLLEDSKIVGFACPSCSEKRCESWDQSCDNLS